MLCQVGWHTEARAMQGLLQTETIIKIDAQVASGNGDPEKEGS